MILEAADRPVDHPVRPVDEVRSESRPHLSVDASYRTTSYIGWLTSAREDVKRRKPLEALARALRAKGIAEDQIREALTPSERGDGWGLSDQNLAFAVLSTDFYNYLKDRPLSPAERKALEAIRLLPRDQAFAELEAGRWDPPYVDELPKAMMGSGRAEHFT
jgi:hypothetical protein